MHYYRVDLTGPPEAIAPVGAEAGQPGAGTTLIVARDDGIDFWESLSRRHPRVTFGIECFEAFEDELVRAVIRDGDTTVMARDSVLPIGWGSYHEEDGEPIDDDLLRAAAESVAEHRLTYEMGTNESGLATACGTEPGRRPGLTGTGPSTGPIRGDSPARPSPRSTSSSWQAPL